MVLTNKQQGAVVDAAVVNRSSSRNSMMDVQSKSETGGNSMMDVFTKSETGGFSRRNQVSAADGAVVFTLLMTLLLQHNYLQLMGTPQQKHIALVGMDLWFWCQSFALLGVQMVINLAFAALILHFIILPRAAAANVRATATSSTSSTTTLQFSIMTKHSNASIMLIGYGVIVPLALATALVVQHIVQFHNVALMLCSCGATAPYMVCRCLEAMYGTMPKYAWSSATSTTVTTTTSPTRLSWPVIHDDNNNNDTKKNNETNLIEADRHLYWLYFACSLQFDFDETTQRPIRVSSADLFNKMRPIRTLLDYWYWGHILNNFLMALLTSWVLECGAAGLGLLTSALTGLQTMQFNDHPLTRCTSVSDFWGKRWDRPIGIAMRRGIFEPFYRRHGGRFSYPVAAIVTFLWSACLHEYILQFMAMRGGQCTNLSDQPYRPVVGNQFAFFVWNCLLLLMETIFFRNVATQSKNEVASSSQMQRSFVWNGWITFACALQRLPQPVQTALVLLTVLPVSHWFTNEYIQSCFYSDAAVGFARIQILNYGN